MAIKVTVKYFCDDESCFASLRVPINENISDYGWEKSKITDFHWVHCPKHNQHVEDSNLGVRIIGKVFKND